MLRKRDSLASSGEMRPGAHLLLNPGVVLGQLAGAAVAVEVGARVADVAEVDVAVGEEQRGQRRPHPGELGVGHRGLVDVAVGLDHGAAQERVHRVRGAGGHGLGARRQQARPADVVESRARGSRPPCGWRARRRGAPPCRRRRRRGAARCCREDCPRCGRACGPRRRLPSRRSASGLAGHRRSGRGGRRGRGVGGSGGGAAGLAAAAQARLRLAGRRRAAARGPAGVPGGRPPRRWAGSSRSR